MVMMRLVFRRQWLSLVFPLLTIAVIVRNQFVFYPYLHEIKIYQYEIEFLYLTFAPTVYFLMRGDDGLIRYFRKTYWIIFVVLFIFNLVGVVMLFTFGVEK